MRRQCDALDRVLDMIVGQPRARPAVDRPMQDPDDQKGEHTGEHCVGEEMPPGRERQQRHGNAEDDRGAVGQRPGPRLIGYAGAMGGAALVSRRVKTGFQKPALQPATTQ